ncbi:MAG: tetratricopeptide repeat protein [Kiloniellales bacterium]
MNERGQGKEIAAAAGLRDRAVALARQGDSATAVTLLEQAIDLFPGFAEAQVRIGNLRRNAGQGEAAIRSYRRALEIKADYAWAHYEYAICLQQIGRFDEAMAHYRSAATGNPKLYKAVLFAIVNQPRGRFRLDFAALRRMLTAPDSNTKP